VPQLLLKSKLRILRPRPRLIEQLKQQLSSLLIMRFTSDEAATFLDPTMRLALAPMTLCTVRSARGELICSAACPESTWTTRA
jgi:hypothetical protein